MCPLAQLCITPSVPLGQASLMGPTYPLAPSAARPLWALMDASASPISWRVTFYSKAMSCCR